MAPPKSEKHESQIDSTNECNSPNIPIWINEENFLSVFQENVEGFRRVLNFEAKETGGDGENYGSTMMRIKVKLELNNGSTKDIAFMIKTLPNSEQGSALITKMGIFPKEATMYDKYLPEFAETYRNTGRNVTFGPQFYKLKIDPEVEYVLLEDLSLRGFKNMNRLEGLDKEHTQSVLKLLAELHAVSAVRFEQKGDFDQSFMVSIFNEDFREDVDTMTKPMYPILTKTFSKHPTGLKYLSKLKATFKNMTQKTMDVFKLDRNGFNVLCHGDLWSNNIMFRHNDEGKLLQTMFVDFQMTGYASPVVDLFYFLLSSPRLDIKVACFDEFVEFYYRHLVENLQLLKYPKKVPTMKQLRKDLLKYSFWAISTVTGVMSAVLLDPTKDAKFDNFFDETKEGLDFRMKIYTNPRYIRHLDVLLPWMDTMGYLDES